MQPILNQNLDQLRTETLEFILKTLVEDSLHDTEWQYMGAKFEATVAHCVRVLTQHKQPVTQPWLIRTIGQCGSGKTTQLLPAIQYGLTAQAQPNYVHLAVRIFSQYHPHYQHLLHQFGRTLIREKTNQLALLLLWKTMEQLIREGYNILLEMTVLEPAFELYLTTLLSNYHYRLNYNIMAVPRMLSDQFIQYRQYGITPENGRAVPNATADFFFTALTHGLQTLATLTSYFSTRDQILMWSATDLAPVYAHYTMDAQLLAVLQHYQSLTPKLSYTEAKLLESKQQLYAHSYATSFPV